jgi:RNA polymerase sigma-70 factor (ECF subfamily)
MINKTNDITMSEELTNDVFMKVHKHLDCYEETKSSMKTWILAIAKNTVIDYYRKRKMLTNSIDNDFESDKFSIRNLSSGSNPHKELVTNETLDIINVAIDGLKPKHKILAIMCFIEQLPYDDIASRLNMPLGTVKGNLFKIRKLLQEELKMVKI